MESLVISSESPNSWRDFVEKSSMNAKMRIEAIRGFDTMSYDQQIDELEKIEKEFLNDPETRYDAKEIAREKEVVKAKMSFENRLRTLGRTVDSVYAH